MSDTPNATDMKAATTPYHCWDCNSSHTALEPCADTWDDLTLVGQREEPLNATIYIDCPTCGGDGEVSAPTPVNYKYDLDTVTCWQCGGKGMIGRRED